MIEHSNFNSNKRLSSINLIKSIIFSLLLSLIAFSIPLQASAKTKDSKLSTQTKSTLNTRLTGWPENLNIFQSMNLYLYQLSSFIHASLIKLSQIDNSPTPFIAQSWKINSSTELTFNLNPKATFSSGHPITSDDIIYSFNVIFNEKLCKNCSSLKNSLPKIKSTKTFSNSPNKYQSIKITLQKPNHQALEKLGVIPIIEKAIYQDSEQKTIAFNNNQAGAGLYTINSDKSHYRSHILLEKRPDHWTNKYQYFLTRYNFDKIKFILLEHHQDAFKAFLNKILDLIYLNDELLSYSKTSLKNFQSNQDKKHIDLIKYPKNTPYSFHFIALNSKKGITKDLKMRQALNHLINRQTLIDSFFEDGFYLVNNPLSYSFNPPKTFSIKYDLEKSTKLLSELGYSNKNKDGILYRIHKNQREQAKLTLLFGNVSDSVWLKTIQQSAKQIGVDIKIRFIDFSQMNYLLDKKEFEAALLKYTSYSSIASLKSSWHSLGSNNYVGYKDSQLDDYFDHWHATKNPQSLSQKIVDKVTNSYLWIYLFSRNSHKAMYWKNKINHSENPYFKYSGNDHHNIFYLHWMPNTISKSAKSN